MAKINLASTQLITDELLGAISEAEQRVVNRMSKAALASARAKAPVRKIFRQARQFSAVRTLSVEELQAEARTFFASPGEEPEFLRFASPKVRRQYQAALAAGITPEAAAINIRRGTQVRTRSDRNNSFQGTFYLRDVSDEGEPSLLNPAAEGRLSTRGRYELTKGRAISPSGQLGGSLRDSIHRESRNTEDIVKAAIVAGGEEAPYARFVEFGTRHAPAQPFLRPALKHVEGDFGAALRQELRKVGRFL